MKRFIFILMAAMVIVNLAVAFGADSFTSPSGLPGSTVAEISVEQISLVNICSVDYECSTISDNFCPEDFSSKSCSPDDIDCCAEKNWGLPGDPGATSYPNGDNLCCGNDPGEFVTHSEYGTDVKIKKTSVACCDTAFSCVHNGVCYPNGFTTLLGDNKVQYECNSGEWNKYVGNCEDIDESCVEYLGGCACGQVIFATVMEQKIGTLGSNVEDFVISQGATINVYSVDDITKAVFSIRTVDGLAELVVIPGDYIVTIEKDRYQITTEEITIGDTNQEIEFNLRLSSDCQNDFTRNDGICHEECYASLVSSQEDLEESTFMELMGDDGRTVVQACTNLRSSWIVGEFVTLQDEKYDLVCCGAVGYSERDVLRKSNPPDAAQPSANFPDVETTCKIVLLPSGEPTTMCVSLWD